MGMLGPSSAEAATGPSDEDIAKIAGIDLNQFKAAYSKPTPSDAEIARVAGIDLATLSPKGMGSITSYTGSNCGDALANFLNSGPLKGSGLSLPRGGIGAGELADLGRTLEMPVYSKGNLTLDNLAPGMVIHMTRKPGDKNYEYGKTHIGIVDKDEQGNMVFRSFTSGKGWRSDLIDQGFINSLPAEVTATNIQYYCHEANRLHGRRWSG